MRWKSIITVASAAVLIGTEVFGAALAGGEAIAGVLGLGNYIGIALQVLFCAAGLYAMAAFLRLAARAEPFTSSPRAPEPERTT